MIKTGKILINGKNLPWFLLTVIPLAYALVGFHFNLLIGTFSLRNMDPEYVYFLSGLGIANGHFHLGYFDHPGTPLQILLALTYRVVYWFRPTDTPFLEDVLGNPDHYLNMANHIATLIMAAALLLSGRAVLKITGSMAAALLIQTVPFFSEITYDIIGRLIPELLIPIPVLIFSVLFLRYIYGQLPADKTRNVAFLALTAAFGLSIKLSFLPLLLIPLFIIPGWKKKLLYMGVTLIAFLLFALPATLEYKTFFRWISGLFVQSGEYGKGEATFIDPEQFRENLKALTQAAKPFFYLAALLLLLAAGYLIFGKKAKSDKKILWLTAGLLLATCLQLLISTKQYSFRYIIPAISFLPLMAILSYEFFNRTFPWRINKALFLVLTLIAFIPGTRKQLVSAQIRSKGIGEEMRQKRETMYYARAIPGNSIKLIVSMNYGAPYPEYAVIYSTAWGGPRMKDYREILGRLYPDAYHFSTWDDQIKTFGEPFDGKTIATGGRPVVLYLEKDSPELMQKSLSKFFSPADSLRITPELIFTNPENGEGLYRLRFGMTESDQEPHQTE